VSVAADDSDAAGDADADGVARGSAPIALTHTKAISATKTRVVVINHHCIDDLSRNGANVRRGRTGEDCIRFAVSQPTEWQPAEIRSKPR